MLEFSCGLFWERINKQCFGGALKVKPEFRIHDTGEALGYFHGDFPAKGECLVEISPMNFGKGDDARELHDTILHEMAHQMQWQLGLPMGHNTSFDSFYSTAKALL